MEGIDPRRVIRTLQDARDIVSSDWGSCSADADAHGASCVSVAIVAAGGLATPESMAAHVALLAAVGVEVPDDWDGAQRAAWDFNDAQTSRASVLAATSKAIANLEAIDPEPSPNADAALEVMQACETAGAVVAHHITREHPELDEREVASCVTSELFYAAQDTAQTCAIGVKLERA